MTIRTVIVDDHRIVREGLRVLLEDAPEIEVVAEAESGDAGVRLCAGIVPDVVLMDINMPGMNGIEATKRILADNPHCRVLALSMHSEKKYVLEMLAAGASGYLFKDCAPNILVEAVRAVAGGKVYVCPGIAAIINRKEPARHSDARAGNDSPLTAREREVLKLLAEGKNTKETAFILGISPKTVETHRTQIIRKLNLRSIAELTRYALRERLTSL